MSAMSRMARDTLVAGADTSIDVRITLGVSLPVKRSGKAPGVRS